MSRERRVDSSGVLTPARRASEPPPGVGVRLNALRSLCITESVAEGAARLKSARPVNHESFELAVARRLRELRALLDLAGYLHRALPHDRDAFRDGR